MTSRDKQSEAPGPNSDNDGNAEVIRRRAEEIYRQKAAQEPKEPEVMSPEEIRLLLHELHVHQIELEMQNEELRRTQVERDITRGRYFNLYDLAPVGYCTISEQGLILEVNLTAANLLGVSKRDLVKQPFTRFIFEKDQEIYYRHRKKLFETGEPQICKLSVLKRDGTPFWAHLVATAAHDDDGVSVCRVVLTDISILKGAEEGLRESEQNFINLVNSGMALIWTAGTDKLCNYFNSVWLQFTGHTLEQEVGNGWVQGVHPEDLQLCLDIYVGAFDKREKFSMEYRLRRHDGEYRWIVDEGCPRYDSKGEFIGYIGHCLDINERKQAEVERAKLEIQLQQAQKMESVGLLAGGVAHDFNNKLTIILGYTEMILAKVEPTEPLFADLQEIRKAAEHSADLTRQLLAFARKQVVMPRVLNLNETVEGMLNMLRRLIGEDIELSWSPDARLWPVKIDPSQVDQIMANLSVNARDAIAGVGKLAIETANSVLDEDYCSRHPGFVAGEYALLAVSDNGCGIDKQNLERVFEPFFTTKAVGEGTGLGLATVYGAVKQNNGFINVYSEPGTGTTFKIYLPRHRSQAVQMLQGSSAEPAQRGRETILLVEDELALLKMTTRILQSLGYAVLAANSPEEAIILARMHADEIDLLITDVIMPEMNGRDLVENLLSFIPQLKYLLMSGYTAKIISQQGILDSNRPFIEKPFTKNDLASKVRVVLEAESFEKRDGSRKYHE